MTAIGFGISYVFNTSTVVSRGRYACQLYIAYAKSLDAVIVNKEAICRIYNIF
jgi:hypothetical protein